MKEFNAIDFLQALENDCVAHSRTGEQFIVDPMVLGPLIVSTKRALIISSARFQALAKKIWFMAQSEVDSKWRVHESEEPREMLKGQENGFDKPEDALDHAIEPHDLASRLEALKCSKDEGDPGKSQQPTGPRY